MILTGTSNQSQQKDIKCLMVCTVLEPENWWFRSLLDGRTTWNLIALDIIWRALKIGLVQPYSGGRKQLIEALKHSDTDAPGQHVRRDVWFYPLEALDWLCGTTSVWHKAIIHLCIWSRYRDRGWLMKMYNRPICQVWSPNVPSPDSVTIVRPSTSRPHLVFVL